MNNLVQKEDKQCLQFFKYTTHDEVACIDVLLKDNNVWLTQKNIALLFGIKVNTVNYHIKQLKIRDKSTIRKFGIVQTEGGRKIERKIDFYNFDAIMFVGCRVNSDSADDFRDWLVQASRRHLIKGFVANETSNAKSQTPTKPTTTLQDKRYLSASSFLTKIKHFLVSLFT